MVSAQFKLIGRVKRRESEARLLGIATNDLEPGEAFGGALEGRERKLGIERGVDERKPEVGRARIDAARWRAHSDRLQEGNCFGERRRVAVAAAAETRDSAAENEVRNAGPVGRKRRVVLVRRRCSRWAARWLIDRPIEESNRRAVGLELARARHQREVGGRGAGGVVEGKLGGDVGVQQR